MSSGDGEVFEGEIVERPGLLERVKGSTQNMGSGVTFTPPSMEALASRGQALRQVKTAHLTAIAVQVPRDLDKVTEEVLRECAIAGDDFYYSWTVKGRGGEQIVEGESIELAMALARNWGNCVVEPAIEEDTSTHWTLSASFVDMQTGMNFKRLYRQRKQGPGGGYDQERALDIAFQIGQSKAIRNAVLAAMPGWLKAGALEAAKKAAGDHLIKRAGGLDKAREMMVEWFDKKGIKQARLEDKLGKIYLQWTPLDVATLRGISQAIVGGETSLKNEFPDPVLEEAQKPATTTATADAIRDRIDQAQKQGQAPPAATPPAKTNGNGGAAAPAAKPPVQPKAQEPPPSAKPPAQPKQASLPMDHPKAPASPPPLLKTFQEGQALLREARILGAGPDNELNGFEADLNVAYEIGDERQLKAAIGRISSTIEEFKAFEREVGANDDDGPPPPSDSDAPPPAKDDDSTQQMDTVLLSDVRAMNDMLAEMRKGGLFLPTEIAAWEERVAFQVTQGQARPIADTAKAMRGAIDTRGKQADAAVNKAAGKGAAAPAAAPDPGLAAAKDLLVKAMWALKKPAGKAALLNMTRVNAEIWPQAIKELVRDGVVYSEGHGPGMQYALVTQEGAPPVTAPPAAAAGPPPSLAEARQLIAAGLKEGWMNKKQADSFSKRLDDATSAGNAQAVETVLSQVNMLKSMA